jgi:hypothetical protein
MKIQTYFLLFTAVLLFGMNSCKKDKLRPINQEELITTVIMTLIDSISGSDTVRLSFSDLDGEGGSSPVIVAENFSNNTTYQGSISVLDESQFPTAVITGEILEEGTDHQFFIQPTPGSLLTYFKYLDADINGKPIGLIFRLRTGGAGSGNLSLILRHEPDKDGAGVSDGDVTNAAGETDVEITFPITVL